MIYDLQSVFEMFENNAAQHFEFALNSRPSVAWGNPRHFLLMSFFKHVLHNCIRILCKFYLGNTLYIYILR
jgi:hypothetical protein